MELLKSEGKCIYCDKVYQRAGITRHLSSHLKELHDSNAKAKAFHLQIPAGEMFLHLLVSGKKSLADLDTFLRAIWLECCGHLSGFQVKGQRYDWDDETMSAGEKMSRTMSDLFKKGMVLQYDYDYGSTTQLEIKVVNEYNIAVRGGIKLLSRNEPLSILCHNCNKKPAVEICSVHVYEGASFFCKACAKKHEKECPDFEDYAAMPVINSPRMGVCAYDGGTIDKKRDGVWKG